VVTKGKEDTMLDTVMTPRTELRAAIARRDAAAEAEANAARSVVHAKSLLDDAEQTGAILADVDHKIAKHRADEIRAWANGGEKPTGELPSHLECVRRFKGEAETKLAEARSTYEILQKELVAASARHTNEQGNVQRAAGAVLSAEAEPIIDQLSAARRSVWELEDKLRSLSTIRVADADGRPVLIQMPAATFAALTETAPPMLAYSVPKPYAIALAKWEAYLQALTQDPNSTLD
jgi:hypothetical protein